MTEINRIPENPELVRRILDGYVHWLGVELIERSPDPQVEAERLWNAPFVVVAHGTEDDPILNYGNALALTLWETDFATLTSLPSRKTAEPMHRDERAAMLQQTREHGYIDNYQGIRISTTGKRFRINQATVWNLLTPTATPAGQAAMFAHWQPLDDVPPDDTTKPVDSLKDRTPGTPPGRGEIEAGVWRLVEVVAKLRSPEGCPWDRVQTMQTIKPYTLEETYELLEAIDANDDADICEELGDVLLQVVLDAQIAADEGRFDLTAVVEGITRKMIKRHPHVFGDATARDAAEVRSHWEAAKLIEKQERQSLLEGIPVALPSLARAARLSKKAASVGYDFPDRLMLFDKLREELDELQREMFPDGPPPMTSAGIDSPVLPDEPVDDAARRDRIEGELGDVLFVMANIARRWGIDPEEALRRSNAKFARRFQGIERGLREQGRSLKEATLEEMEQLYQEFKAREKGGNGSDDK
ncbi:MAG: nucleoside triphosphate pyrophosphohydrolase [Planctomycetaceae bacterium]